MGGPADGKYYIRFAAGIRPRVGVDDVGAHVTPVITDGRDDVWTVKKLKDGNYRLFIEEPGRRLFIQANKGEVVASNKPPPSPWGIEEVEGGSYTIKLIDEIPYSSYWTLSKLAPKSPIILVWDLSPSPEDKWDFTPA